MPPPEERSSAGAIVGEPLALSKATLQPGSKVELMLHENTLCSNGKRSKIFRVDYREPLPSGNLTKDRIRSDKMIHQLMSSQFQCHS
jgi:hypothetical protein